MNLAENLRATTEAVAAVLDRKGVDKFRLKSPYVFDSAVWFPLLQLLPTWNDDEEIDIEGSAGDDIII